MNTLFNLPSPRMWLDIFF